MKKADLLLIFLLTATLLLLPSCKNTEVGNTEQNTPPDKIISSEPLSSGGKIIPGYVKLEDINPDAVPEISIGRVGEAFQCVSKTEDGLLIGYISGVISSWNVRTQRILPIIRKLDNRGNLMWERQYDYEVAFPMKIMSFHGLKNILPYPDGGYVFSVQASTGSSNGTKSFIIKCDRDGNEIWKRDFDDYPCEAIRSLLVTENGEIIVVGNAYFLDGKQLNEYRGEFNILITKFDSNGNLLQQKNFGGTGSDMVYAARYDKKLGIIFRGVTDSKDGEFAITKDRENAQFAARIDENLNFKWVFHADVGEHFSYDQIAAGDDCIYIPGGFNTEPIEEFLIKVDENGKILWKKQGLCRGLLINAIAVLKNGDVVIGAGFMNKGILLILDKDGIDKKRLETPVNTITPTRDGGLITTSTREIKTIPMPLTSSSIWYDTELAADKYKGDYSIEWHKTYDKVKDATDKDFAFPFEDGSMAVE